MRTCWGLAPLLFCQFIYAEGVIAIYPSPATVVGGDKQSFLSYITVSPNTVTWSVNGVLGGDSTYGTIVAGVYQRRLASLGLL